MQKSILSKYSITLLCDTVFIKKTHHLTILPKI